MTINKAQGQTFNRVGIHLAIERPCFFTRTTIHPTLKSKKIPRCKS